MKRLMFLLFLFFSTELISQTISASSSTAYYICSDRRLMVVGHGNYGQVANGSTTNNNLAALALISNLIAVSGGWEHCIGLKEDGSLWGWGHNIYGELGIGSTSISEPLPLQIATPPGIVGIAAGRLFSLAFTNDGTIWGWGQSEYGELGDTGYIQLLTPYPIIFFAGKVISISAGSYHAAALMNEGTVWAWGSNVRGNLGNNSFVNSPYPVQVIGLTRVKAISSGGAHTIALKADSTVWTWGWNGNGQLGDSTQLDRSVPLMVNNLNEIIAVAAGYKHSLALKNDGTVWAWGDNINAQLGIGTTVPSSVRVPVQVLNLTGVVSIAAGDNFSIALKNDGSVWAWGDNLEYQIGGGSSNTPISVPSQVLGLCYVLPTFKQDYTLRGSLYGDLNQDCLMQTVENKIPTIPVLATPGNYFTYSNDSGEFAIGLNDSVNYLISPIIPQYLSQMIKNSCPVNYTAHFDSTMTIDTSGFNFGYDFAPCHYLRVDLTGQRKRTCFNNSTLVYYVNDGFTTVQNVEIHVHFSHGDIPVSATLPFTWNNSDSSIVFEIDSLQPSESGIIKIIDSVACQSSLFGLTLCTEARIYPRNECYLDSTAGIGWDSSSTVVNGRCVNDTVIFIIRNNGSGDMLLASQYRIYSDNFLVQTGIFQLNSSDSLILSYVSMGSTIRLEADQNPGHPGLSHPRATIEGCDTNTSGTFSMGMVNLVPQDDNDVDIEIDCMIASGPVDPNEKKNSPEGIGLNHTILPETPIDYTIYFQNTGTDTAYNIIVTDTLSSSLDISTLELGVGSYNYDATIIGAGNAVLKFTFNNINLVDSNMDEPNSHGFVKFKITPFDSTHLGTVIENTADIYFDFNAPIKTNVASVTLGNYINVSVGEFSETGGMINYYPNPTFGTFHLESKNNTIKKILIYSVDGKLVQQNIPLKDSKKTTLNLENLQMGIYFLECIFGNYSEMVKVVKY